MGKTGAPLPAPSGTSAAAAHPAPRAAGVSLSPEVARLLYEALRDVHLRSYELHCWLARLGRAIDG